MLSEVLVDATENLLIEQVEIAAVLLAPAEQTVLLEVAEQGPPGIQGLPGQAGVTYLSFLADGALGGHRVVAPTTAGKVGYADSVNPLHANSVVGITRGAAADGEMVHVQLSGEMTEPSWNWVQGQPVFLAADGQLTQVAPLAGFCLMVGKPTAATTLLIGIEMPFILEI